MSETHWLWQQFTAAEAQTALIWRDQQVSYRQLQARIVRWQEVLQRYKIAPGECVALQGDYAPETCALLLTLFFNRNIVVPLTHVVGDKQAAYQDIAQVRAVFEFDQAETWRFSRRSTATAHPLIEQVQQQGVPGLILFSSGSTGQSKASLLNLAKLANKFQAPASGYRTLVFLLLDHIGGLNTLFHVLSHGGTVVVPEDRSPASVCQAIAQYRIQLLPTTPTFLKMLLISEAYQLYDLSSLELITYGTEPMPASTLRHLCQVFPQVRCKQTYGLSELGILPTRSQGSDSLLLQVGGAGYEVKVLDNLLWIRADTAMLGYLNAPTPFDAEGWFNTGDVVETHGEYLRIVGRVSEMINVGGEKVYPAEVESVLLEMDNICDVLVQGKANPVAGQVVVARVCLVQEEDAEALRKRLRQFCQGRLAPYKIPVFVDISTAPLHSERFKKARARVAANEMAISYIPHQ